MEKLTIVATTEKKEEIFKIVLSTEALGTLYNALINAMSIIRQGSHQIDKKE